ncbi:MAG: hypothetical protein ACI4DP_08795 [Candidatus Ornithomonoglobus sp.]
MKKTKIIFTAAVLTAAVITGGSAVAFGEEAETDTAAYSYTTGQQKCSERHSKFEKVSDFETDEERDAYFAEQGIGRDENPYVKDAEDADDANDADDAETADDTASYGYSKGKQKHTSSEYDGKNVEEQLEDGAITQDEADAIKAEAGIKHDEIHARFAK